MTQHTFLSVVFVIISCFPFTTNGESNEICKHLADELAEMKMQIVQLTEMGKLGVFLKLSNLVFLLIEFQLSGFCVCLVPF